jgi:hypothetical protein
MNVTRESGLNADATAAIPGGDFCKHTRPPGTPIDRGAVDYWPG